jgi:hypothetical protein
VDRSWEVVTGIKRAATWLEIGRGINIDVGETPPRSLSQGQPATRTRIYEHQSVGVRCKKTATVKWKTSDEGHGSVRVGIFGANGLVIKRTSITYNILDVLMLF